MPQLVMVDNNFILDGLTGLDFSSNFTFDNLLMINGLLQVSQSNLGTVGFPSLTSVGGLNLYFGTELFRCEERLSSSVLFFRLNLFVSFFVLAHPSLLQSLATLSV